MAKSAPRISTLAPTNKSSPRRPDVSVGVQPTVRVFSHWTTERLLFAEAAANVGNLRPAADFCEWLMGDDRIGPLLQIRAESLLGLNPTFEKAGDNRRSGRAVRALEAEQDWWRAYPDSELAQILIWGILLGVAPARHRWINDEKTGRMLPMPEFWHPQHLRRDMSAQKWLISVAQPGNASAGTEEELVPGDGSWILHTPYSATRPWAMGLWRPLSRMALLKVFAIGDWSKHGEKGALLAATSSPSVVSSRDQRAELARDIYDRGREAVAAMPPGFDLKLVESLANTRNLYEAQIDMANTAISIAIRGGNLTTEVLGGSLAAAEIQERLGDDAKRRFDAQKLVDTLHSQSLPWWASFNFGDPNLAPWPVYPVDARDDLKLKAETMLAAMKGLAIAVSLGFKLDRQSFAEDFEADGFLGEPPDHVDPLETLMKAEGIPEDVNEDQLAVPGVPLQPAAPVAPKPPAKPEPPKPESGPAKPITK